MTVRAGWGHQTFMGAVCGWGHPPLHLSFHPAFLINPLFNTQSFLVSWFPDLIIRRWGL